jgi:hypothetical protein
MVVVCIAGQHTLGVAFAENDHVVEAFSPERANDTLPIGVLPRRPGCPVDGIAVTDQIRGRLVWPTGFQELSRCPFGIDKLSTLFNSNPVSGCQATALLHSLNALALRSR